MPLQLTVVQEFRLATSRRAEWDASRASEDARLTTEERSAKKVGAGRRFQCAVPAEDQRSVKGRRLRDGVAVGLSCIFAA